MSALVEITYLVIGAGGMTLPILLLAVVALGVAVLRTSSLVPTRWQARSARQRLDAILEHDRLDDLADPGPHPLEHVLAIAQPYLDEAPPGEAAAVLELAARHEADRLHRGFGTLHLVVLLAPVCGLCGTVVAYATMWIEAGTQVSARPDLIGQGVAEAFYTTALGLAVAIPTQIALTTLRAWAERTEAEIEDAVNRLLLHLASR